MRWSFVMALGLALSAPGEAAQDFDITPGQSENPDDSGSFQLTVQGRQCGREGVQVQVLGAGGPELDDGMAASGFLVWIDGRARVMIDAGGGVPVRFEASGAEFADLETIAFTHLQPAHSAGFPALVQGAEYVDRERDLPVYGPAGNDLVPGMVDWVNRVIGAKGAYPYLSDVLTSLSSSGFKIVPYQVPSTGRRIWSDFYRQDLELSSIPVDHGPFPAVAWRVDTERVSITFTGDATNAKGTLAELAAGSNILVASHAIPEQARGTARRLHMPPSQIGKLAARAEVDMLILAHRTNRTRGRESRSRREISEHYNGSILFANDLECWGL